MYLLSELNVFPALLLLAIWTLGGWLITARAFNLPAHERVLVSVGVGLVTGTWLANWLARWLPPSLAFWGAALLTVALGLVMARPLSFRLPSLGLPQLQQGLRSFTPLLLFSVFVVMFTLIGRGFAFFDDHQNLAPVSIMATGDVPPHFSYNPDLRFGYHYFLLLVASQFVRLASAGPWTALDLARGLTLALTLSYGGFIALRITRSRLAQTFSMIFMAFAGGARWLFLLLPLALQRQLSSSVQMIGSGADTGPNLITAIYKYWKIEGLGPLPFPFMYGSGLDPSFSMLHNGWGTSAIAMALLLMLLVGAGAERRSAPTPGFISSIPIVILLASMALANEVTFAFLYFGLACAALTWVVQKKSLRLPRSLWTWVGLMFIAGVLALLQGGMFTEVARGMLIRVSEAASRLVNPVLAPSAGSTYFNVSFAIGAPTVLSSHLGYLSLLNPLQWVAILGETGLVIFALPIVLKQIVGFSRDENWLEAAWIGSIVISLLMVFVQYTGNAGPTAASRMQAHFLTVLKIYAVPLLWIWVHSQRVHSGQVSQKVHSEQLSPKTSERKKHPSFQTVSSGKSIRPCGKSIRPLDGSGENIKTVVFLWGLATIFSGVSLFGLQMAAMPNPVYAIYLDQLDAQMFTRQWDRLAPNTMVYDPNYPRAATIFGRPIRSSKTMGETLPEWNALGDNPDPYKLKAAGYDYLYVDQKYHTKYASIIQQDCASLIDHVEDRLANSAKVVDARYLYQVTGCH